MTEETQQSISITEMITKTNENTYEFYKHVANHIRTLEELIIKQQYEIAELKGEQYGSNE